MRERRKLTGFQILTDPARNAGTAFTSEQREAMRLHGLLPPVVETLDQQCERAYRAFLHKTDDLERHIYLRALQDTNETLFYALLLRHIEEMAPVIYTPIVALGCRHFSQIYRRPRGLFLSWPLRGRLDEMLANRPYADVDVVVVTDGERVLGIGDQGAGGMGIAIGKLSLYTLIGGVPPERTLPVLLDTGTNNAELLADPEYIGWRHPRIAEDAYWAFVDAFVEAVDRCLPGVLLQWEDFAQPHARPILERYRDRLCTFNDDIQGTASVTLAALYGATRRIGMPFAQQRFVIAGAGSAGVGLADYLVCALVAEGLSERDAAERCLLVNSGGLLRSGDPRLTPAQRRYARDEAPATLAEVIERHRPTTLIGLSTVPGLFSQDIVGRMCAATPRPIIFPLSNPADRAEAAAADLIAWTNGAAIVATGSPTAPVTWNGRVIHITQCNNFYVFPAMGLAAVAGSIRRVTDGMLLAIARDLGGRTSMVDGDLLLPPLRDVRSVVPELSLAAVLQAQREGRAPDIPAEEIRTRIANRFWMPSYPASFQG